MMEAIEAVKHAANVSHVPITQIGIAMGKRPNYVSVAANKNQRLRSDVLARMLDVCGYGLFAIPYGHEPNDAIQITADND